jgi:polyhydroxybutyrate depolymerase
MQMTQRWRRRSHTRLAVAGAVVLLLAVVVLHVTRASDEAAGSELTDPGAVSAPVGPPKPLPPGVTGTTVALDYQGLTRSYLAIVPDHPSHRLPLLVVLHGRNVGPAVEKDRTGFVPFAAAGQAAIVLPAGVSSSWNAGACCGAAQARGIDDVGFVTEVVHRAVATLPVDPAQVYVVGYSNGGKLAFGLLCHGPAHLFAAAAVVASAPVTDCPTGPPVSLLAVMADGDPNVAFGSGRPVVVNGYTEPTLSDTMAQWRARDQCPPTPVVVGRGQVTVTTSSGCAAGTKVVLAHYAHGGHAWPAGDATTPSATSLVWSFFAPRT